MARDENTLTLDIELNTQKAIGDFDDFTDELSKNTVLSDTFKTSFESAISPLKTILDSFNGLPSTFSKTMTSVATSLTGSLRTIISDVEKIQSKGLTESRNNAMMRNVGLATADARDLQNAIKSFQAIQTLNNDMQRKITDNIGGLGRLARDIMREQRSPVSDLGIEKILMNDPRFKVASKSLGFDINDKANKAIVSNIMNILRGQYVDKFQRSDYLGYASARSGGAIKMGSIQTYDTVADRLTGPFRNMKFNMDQAPETNRRFDGKRIPIGKRLQSHILDMAAGNELLRQELVRTGMAGMVNGEIAIPEGHKWYRDQVNELTGGLYHQLGVALQSMPRFRRNVDTTNADEQKKLAGTVNRRTDLAYAALNEFGTMEGIQEWLAPYYAIDRKPLQIDRTAKYKGVQIKNYDPLNERYQVPTYSITELMNGRTIPLDYRERDPITGKKNTEFKHGFVDIEASRMTRLLGMHGHNTYGVQGDVPAIIAVNSDDMFVKNSNGQYEYETDKNGKSTRKVDEKVRRYIADSIDKGIEQYGDMYDFMAESSSGEYYFGRRDLMQKAIADAAAKGIGNPFTSFSDKKVYKNRQEAIKALEYNSKISTNAVPLRDFGFETPRYAHINLDAYYDALGIPESERHDGSNIINPEYLPFAAQVRDPSIKGTMMPLDYREYLKRAGLVKDGHFYMPSGYNVTADDVRAFMNGKLKPGDEGFDDKFVDLMDTQYGALLFNSTFKNDAALTEGHKTRHEQEDYINKLVQEYGTEIVRTAKSFDKEKDWIPAQVARGTKFSDAYEGIKSASRSMLNRELSTINGLIEHVFTGDSDLDRQIREEGRYDLLSSHDAQERIAAFRKSIEQRFANGEIYAPGYNRMMMAAMAPGNIFNDYAEKVLHQKANDWGKGAELTADEIYAQSVKSAETAIARTPSGPSQKEYKYNIAAASSVFGPPTKEDAQKIQTFEDMRKDMGLDVNAVYSSRAGIYGVGTADFDGDFLSIMNGMIVRSIVDNQTAWGKTLKEISEKQEQKIAQDKKDTQKATQEAKKEAEAVAKANENVTLDGDTITYNAIAAANSRGIMAQTNNNNRALAGVNWNDPEEVKKAIEAERSFYKSYDQASSKKTRDDATIDRVYANVARQMGVPIEVLLNHVSSDIENEDYAYSGHAILNKTLPSIFDKDAMNSIIAANIGQQEGNVNSSDIEHWFQEITELNKGNVDDAQGRYVQKWFDIASKITTGKAAYVSKEDLADLEMLYAQYGQQVAMNQYDGEMQDRYFRLGSSLDVLKKRGVTEANIEAGLGYGQMLVDAGMHSTSWARENESAEYQLEQYRQQQQELYRQEQEKLHGAKHNAAFEHKRNTYFSLSDLNMFMQDPEKLLDKMHTDEDPQTAYARLGSIYHSVLQSYADNRMNGTDADKAAEDALANLDKLLADEQKNNKGFNDVELRGRLGVTHERMSQLFDFLKDKKILAAEQGFKLNWQGVKGDQSYGAADLIYEDADGQRYLMDLKAAFEGNETLQAFMYAALHDREISNLADETYKGVNIKQGGMGLGADGKSLLQKVGYMSLGLKNVKDGKFAIDVKDYDKETGEKVLALYEEVAQLADEVQEKDIRGEFVSVEELRKRVNAIKEKHKSTLALIDPRFAEEETIEQITNQQNQKQTKTQQQQPPAQNPPPTNPPAPPSNPPTNPPAPPSNPPTNPPVNTTTVVGQNIADSVDAQEIAKRIENYISRVDDLGGTFYKEKRRASPDMQSSGNGRFAYYARQMDQLGEENQWFAEQYKNGNISDSTFQEKTKQFVDLRRDFLEAMRLAAVNDIEEAIDNITEAINGIQKETARQKQIAGVSEEYTKATQTLATLSAEQEKAKDALRKGGMSEADIEANPLIRNNQKAIDDAREQAKVLTETAQEYVETTVSGITDDISSLESLQKGIQLPQFGKIDKAVQQFEKRKQDLLDDTKKLVEEFPDLFKAERGTQVIDRIGKIDVDAYRSRLQQEYLDSVDADISRDESVRARGIGRRNAFQQTYDAYQRKADVLEKRNEGYRSQIAALNNTPADSAQYETAKAAIEKYNAAIRENDKAIEQLRGDNGKLNASLQVVGNAVSNVIKRFGRQMFQQAIREARQFVQQFNASMIEIQTITLKTDEEMATIRQTAIDTAIQMRTSVGDVTKVQAELYRQGLDDTEVNSRMQSIIKFATVAKINTETATKIITTALQNNLVSSAQEAMDSLVALGDSAATTAAEIAKAMQKCAASANVAGVSYGELNAMLTVMTSRTQLSGTQVGTALNTLLSRFRNVTSNKYTKDINGESTSLNEVEAALNLAGINMRNEQGTDFRNPVDVLLDISKRWGSMNDVQMANLSTAMAGTRAANMFNTLMEGMAEDNGELFEKYLRLAEDSEGITDAKYEVAVRGINAALNELKSTFDGLVASFESDTFIVSSIDILTGIIDGVRQLSSALGGLGSILPIIAAAFSAFAAKTLAAQAAANSFVGMMYAANPMLIAIAGAVAGVAALGGLSKVASMVIPHTATDEEVASRKQEEASSFGSKAQSKSKELNSTLSEMESLLETYEELEKQGEDTSAVNDQLNTSFGKLKSNLPSLKGNIEDTTRSLEDWKTIVDEAKDAIDNFETVSNATRFRLAREAQEAKNDAIESEGSGAQSENDTYSLYSRMTPIIRAGGSSMFVRPEGFDENNPFADATSLKYSMSQVLGYAMNPYSADDALLADVGRMLYDNMMEMPLEERPDYYQAGDTSENGMMQLARRFSENISQSMTGRGITGWSQDAFDSFINSLLEGNILGDYQSGKQSIDDAKKNGYVEGLVQTMLIDPVMSMIGDVGEEEAAVYQSGLTNMMKSAMAENTSLDGMEFGKEYMSVLTDIATGLQDELLKKLKDGADPKNLVDDTADAESFAYRVEEIYDDGDLHSEDISYYKTLDEAKAYAESAGVPFTAIKDNNTGESVYQTTEQALRSLMQSYKTSNKTYSSQILDLVSILNDDYASIDDLMSEIDRQHPGGINDFNAILGTNQNAMLMWNSMLGDNSPFTQEDLRREFLGILSGQTMESTYGLRQRAMNSWLGEGWDQLARNGNLNWQQALMNLGDLKETDPGLYNFLQSDVISKYDGFAEIIQAVGSGAQVTSEMIDKLNNSIMSDGVAALEKYNQYATDVVDTLLRLRGTPDEVISGMSSMNSHMSSLYERNLAIDDATGRSGAELSDATVSTIANQFSISEDQVRALAEDDLKIFVDAMKSAAEKENTSMVGEVLARSILADLNSLTEDQLYTLYNSTNGEINSNTIGQYEEYLSPATRAMLARNRLYGNDFSMSVGVDAAGVATSGTPTNTHDPNAINAATIRAQYAETARRTAEATQRQLNAWIALGEIAQGDFASTGDWDKAVDEAIKGGKITKDQYQGILESFPKITVAIEDLNKSAETATEQIRQNVQNAINDMLGISADQHSRNISNLQTLLGGDVMRNILRGEAFTATAADRDSMYQAIASMEPEDYSRLTQSYEGLSEIIGKINNGQEITVDDLRTLNNAMMTEGVTAADKYNKALKQIADTLAGLNGDQTDFLQTFTGIMNGITSLHDQMFAINQAEGKNGWELDDETVAQLSKITSFDEQYIKTRNNEQLQRIMPLARRAVEEQYSNQTAGLFGAGFADFINTKNAEYGKNNANKTLTYSSEQLKENSIPWLSDTMKDQLDMMTSDGSSFEIQLKFDENGIATLADYSATMGDFMNWYSNSLVGDTFADTLQNVRNSTSQENTEAITRRSLVEEMRTAYGEYGADFAANMQANTAEVVKQLQDPQLRDLIDLMQGKTNLKLDDMAIDRMLTNFKTGAVSTNDSMNNQFMSFLFGSNWEQDAEQGTLAFQEAYNQLQSLADNPLLSAYASHVLEHFGLSGDALLDYVDDAEDAKDASLEVANVWTSDMSSASNSFKTYLEGVSKNLQTLRSDASDALDAMKSLIEEMHNLNDTEYTIMRNRGRSGLELDERGRQLFLDEGYTNPEIDRWSRERVDTELGFIQTRKQRERYAQQEGAVNEAITGLNGAVRSGEGIQVGNENSFRSLTNENITSLTGTASDLVNILKSNSSMDPEGMVAAQLSRLVEQFGDFTVTLDKNIDEEGNVVWKNGGITTDRTAPSGYSDSYLGANAEETIQNYANSGSYDLGQTIDFAKGMSNLLEMAQTAQNVDELRTKLQGSGEEFNEVINKVMEDGSKVGEILKNMFNNGDNSIYSMSDLMNAVTSSMGLGTQNEAVMASGFVNQVGFSGSDLTAMEHGTLTDFSEAKSFVDMLEESGQLDAFINATSNVEGMTAALRELQSTGKITAETQKTLANSIKNTTARAMFDGRRNADELAESYRKLTGRVSDQVKEITRLNKQVDQANDLAVASNKVSKAKNYAGLDKTTKSVVQEFLGMSDQELKNTKMDMSWLSEALMNSAREEMLDAGENITSEISALINDTMANNEIAAQAFVDMEVVGADGTMNMEKLRAWCAKYCQNAAALIQSFAGWLGTLELEQRVLPDGSVEYVMNAETYENVKSGNFGKKGYSGGHSSKGGGDSEKNEELEKLLKSIDRAEQLVQHRLKMLQYKEEYYETMGEWTNMNSALMDENKIQQELIDTYTESINKLQEQLNVLEYGSDDWDKVAKNILKYEEAIEGANNAIEFNNKKIKENQEKIRQLRITLEDMVVEEIKKRIQKQRDMLAATVEMEEIITDAIKLRYQKEWDRQVRTD